jgi:hypothetical protein
VAPERAYWEYSAGVGNIQIVRLDFTWRGILNNPDAQNFTIKASIGFTFKN